MIKNIAQLKKDRPDLVIDFEKMSKEELLNQCYLECIDGINMESRVALFMQECTNNYSNTTYDLDVLRILIEEKKHIEIDEFCYYETCDGQTNKEILESVVHHSICFLKNK